MLSAGHISAAQITPNHKRCSHEIRVCYAARQVFPNGRQGYVRSASIIRCRMQKGVDSSRLGGTHQKYIVSAKSDIMTESFLLIEQSSLRFLQMLL